jgi:hypothetical protein
MGEAKVARHSQEEKPTMLAAWQSTEKPMKTSKLAKVVWLQPSEHEWLLVNSERTTVFCRVTWASNRYLIFWERPARMQGPFASLDEARQAAEKRLGVSSAET